MGRLDYASEGLLLLTNDGELAHQLMKAASHVAKTYVVKVAGTPRMKPLPSYAQAYRSRPMMGNV